MATTQWRQIPVAWIKRAGMLGAVIVAVAGCATTRDEIFPKEGPTMVDIYDDITSGQNTLVPKHKKYKKKTADDAAKEQEITSARSDETNWFMYENLKKDSSKKSSIETQAAAEKEAVIKPATPRQDLPSSNDDPQRSKAALIPVSTRGHAAALTGTEIVNEELRAQFQRVENPVIVLWVAPHRSAEGLPIPAYSTAFRMYEKDEFAQPGEVTE